MVVEIPTLTTTFRVNFGKIFQVALRAQIERVRRRPGCCPWQRESGWRPVVV